ncbi:circularly permuted type 2 ATP-grasp protein [Ectothiorhodospira shaposhnikovii]|uniref:circularly permuted type 2 ATP-grasp protein n=1 Tax=Ectothiorhodospira shaposhnikovii TaxID=1054 RepID=UPI0039A2A553
MSTPTPLSLLAPEYALSGNRFDELLTPEGVLRPQWEPIMGALVQLGPEGLAERAADIGRLLRESGVTYNVYSDPRGAERPWPLDPVPMVLESKEWAVIETGLIQRAELLNLILKDLYGPRELIRKGLLPLDLIYGYPGFLRPCVGSLPTIPNPLALYAADLVRRPDGHFVVLGDRTQAPSGAGYALENRVILSRVFPSLYRDAQAHRLTRFFQTLRRTLATLRAPAMGQNEPRVVLLSPGPLNETWFEHVYLAGYLGYTLVQGQDLVVSEGRVWLRSLNGPEPVDVILRRVDDGFCDPLELRQDSWLGVAGLLEVARRGRVAIINPLGSGVLECPALSAYLPAIARHLLGQDLILSTVETWWCGDPRQRDHVLSRLERLVIRDLEPGRSSAVFGDALSRPERESLEARIRANPGGFVAQERLELSTLPAFGPEGDLEPRRGWLRTYLCARDGDYVVMPGGLSRVAGARDAAWVSNQAGGVSKDTWVLASEAEPSAALVGAMPMVGGLGTPVSLSGRVAENLFWMGRYAERAEGTLRLMLVVLMRRRLVRESGGSGARDATLRTLLRALTHLTATYPGFVLEGAETALIDPAPELLALILDRERIGSLSFTLQSLLRAGHELRDRISGDSWRVISALRERSNALGQWQPRDPEHLVRHLDELITHLLAMSGLAQESTPRHLNWVFLDAGRRLERGLMLAGLLRATLVRPCAPEDEPALLEAVLNYAENTAADPHALRPEALLDSLLLDERNPRSLGFQLAALECHGAAMPRTERDERLTPAERLILEARNELRRLHLRELALPDTEGHRQALDQCLARQQHLLGSASDALSRSYFDFTRSQHLLVSNLPEPGI